VFGDRGAGLIRRRSARPIGECQTVTGRRKRPCNSRP
jgi:hypothetical protein